MENISEVFDKHLEAIKANPDYFKEINEEWKRMKNAIDRANESSVLSHKEMNTPFDI